MKPAENIIRLPKRSGQTKIEEAAFLPAALEIVETPASPVGRAIAWTIIAVFCLSIGWASISQVDVIASAPGKVVPAGGTKVIQPFEIGIVRAIHVRDGQEVKAGDLLIQLDPTINQSDRDHFRSDLLATELEIARLKAALADPNKPLDGFHPPQDATPAQVAMQRDFLMKQTAEYQAKIDGCDRQLEQKLAERDTIQATVGKLSAIVPIIQQRVDIRKISAEQEFTSRFQYLEIVQQLVEQQQELVVQRSRLRETQASLAVLTESRAQAVAEFQRTLFGQLAEAERKADGLRYDIAKAEQKLQAQNLIAPIGGTVQQLSVHTVGGVVSPAQVLLTVVPSQSHLEIEAMVANNDIGFVHPNQAAEIKVDTFNFTKYGLLHGEVMSVSQDAVVRDKPADRSEKNQGSENASSEPKGQELSFSARISLDRTQMQVDDKLINLTPGMAVTVEIKTGVRSVLAYVLSPLIKYGHDSLRER
ncbi:HlyD family type I secretion periplasmic adaptor subunit [Bradyrhizobium genosp. P]|uniref:HlyD family type I secretion periplasmic adaptor subunit n=1 Tax=Bradyrhizobium genosp. P TaxID=83641 RepID=UPI003CEEA86C